MPDTTSLAVHPIQRYRDQRQWSRWRLSKESGVNRVTIVLIETGKTTRPNLGTLVLLARALEVPVDFLRPHTG